MRIASGVSAPAQTGGTQTVRTQTGSPAEIAYREAVRDLAKAQQKLAKSSLEGASQEQIEADQAAVAQAAAAVSLAAAELAEEQRAGGPEDRQVTTVDPGAQPQRTTALTPAATSSAVRLPTSPSIVDVVS